MEDNFEESCNTCILLPSIDFLDLKKDHAILGSIDRLFHHNVDLF